MDSCDPPRVRFRPGVILVPCPCCDGRIAIDEFILHSDPPCATFDEEAEKIVALLEEQFRAPS